MLFLHNRENLDPFEERSDAEQWAALETCHMGEAVRALGGLDGGVSEGGGSLSMGQAQLLCLARVLLRKSKVSPQYSIVHTARL